MEPESEISDRDLDFGGGRAAISLEKWWQNWDGVDNKWKNIGLDKKLGQKVRRGRNLKIALPGSKNTEKCKTIA